jgi:hypothetical protein
MRASFASRLPRLPQQPAFASPVADLARLAECRGVVRARLADPAQRLKRAAGHRVDPRLQRDGQRAHRLHQQHQIEARGERPAKPDASPGAFECLRSRPCIAAGLGAATGRHQVVEFDAALRRDLALVQARVVGAVPRLGGLRRLRAAPRVTAGAA